MLECSVKLGFWSTLTSELIGLLLLFHPSSSQPKSCSLAHARAHADKLDTQMFPV